VPAGSLEGRQGRTRFRRRVADDRGHAIGIHRRESGDRTPSLRAESVDEARLGADEDVPPFEKVRPELLEGRIGNLESDHVAAGVLQAVQHREGKGVACTRRDS
jgi:hypothetical protein